LVRALKFVFVNACSCLTLVRGHHAWSLCAECRAWSARRAAGQSLSSASCSPWRFPRGTPAASSSRRAAWARPVSVAVGGSAVLLSSLPMRLAAPPALLCLWTAPTPRLVEPHHVVRVPPCPPLSHQLCMCSRCHRRARSPRCSTPHHRAHPHAFFPATWSRPGRRATLPVHVALVS
jgi:hypothetical protein